MIVTKCALHCGGRPQEHLYGRNLRYAAAYAGILATQRERARAWGASRHGLEGIALDVSAHHRRAIELPSGATYRVHMTLSLLSGRSPDAEKSCSSETHSYGSILATLGCTPHRQGILSWPTSSIGKCKKSNL
eukprot:1576953-Amphidinium_carterae.1